jgi:outer membrane protein assembly factor BamA
MQRIGKAARLLYLGEILTLRAEDEPAGRAITLSGGTDFIPRLGLGWLWDGRDRRLHPRRGLYQEFRFTRNGGWLGGDADYGEWLSDTRAYLPWSERNVLHLGALYQYRTGILGETFPVYDRFHAGGVNTLRGYGPDALQGRNEWIATVENRVDLIRKRVVRLWSLNGHYAVQGVAGVEAASLWGHDALMEGDFRAGVYAGLHILFAGVDRIRLELGSKTARLDMRFDVGIMEKADIQRFRAR